MAEESLYLFFIYVNDIINTSFQTRGGYGTLRASSYFFKVFHVNVGNDWTYN